MIKIMKRVYGKAADLLFPRRCPVCDRPVRPSGELICPECESDVRYICSPFCMKCGKSLDSDEKELCHDCTVRRHVFDSGRSLFEYRSICSSVYAFKYKGRQEYAEYYGDRISEMLGKVILSWKPDALIPVPIHESRRRERGYNQSDVLAKAIGKRIDIPVYTDWISRCRNTAPQKELEPAERQKNLKMAFKIILDDVKLNSIVIIDDIYTTGSTIDNVAQCAKDAGVKKIYFITLSIGKGM